ncbi:MAG: hypothetical protein H3C34_26135 [Caldilineaceae bacterium]|nr:hypothetical protein [Caldilineaceae bacterium]
MRDTLTISIAGLAVVMEISQLPDTKQAELAARYCDFDGWSPPDAVHLGLRMRAGDPYVEWHNGQPLPLHTWRRRGRILVASPTEWGWYDSATQQASLVLRPAGDPENFLRVLFGWLALAQGGLLLHACGVICDGDGYVFVGPSGAGKSTVAGLSAGATVLSDDLVLVERRADGYWVHGVPFRGSGWTAPRVNAAAPLRALLSLVQAPEHKVASLPKAEGVARLVGSTPFVTTTVDGARAAIGNAVALQADTPVQELKFRKDRMFWDVIRAAAAP